MHTLRKLDKADCLQPSRGSAQAHQVKVRMSASASEGCEEHKTYGPLMSLPGRLVPGAAPGLPFGVALSGKGVNTDHLEP